MEVKKKIKEMLDAGQVDIAKLLIREFQGLHPRDADIYLWKAEIHMLENKLDEAQRALVEAIGFEYQRFDLFYKLANVYFQKKEFVLAVSLYRRSMELTEDENKRTEIQQCIDDINKKLSSTNEMTDRASKPLVSIIVLAYNHLEYTKQCMDSIYRYTMHLPIELITVNNGSSDGTAAYFNELPNHKKVTLAANVGPVNGFNAGMMVAEGRYTACISNDFIVTKGWLDNLLICMESDPTIGFVSPGADSVSNNQRIICPNAVDLEEMQRFAESYNISNPDMWEERVRLLPCVLMVRTELLKQVGYFDPRFIYGEFADDDISFRIRRAGNKLIFVKDTFTHHFGSVTVGEEQRQHQSLEVSREIFRDKYGIDAWEDTGFDIHLVDTATECIQQQRQRSGTAPQAVRILGINAKCGSTPLQLRNKLRENGFEQTTIVNYTDQSKYMVDLLSVSETAKHGLLTELKDFEDSALYDVILLEGGLEPYPRHQIDSIINGIRSKLCSGGLLLFKMQNGAHYLQIARWLSDRTPFLQTQLSNTFFHLQPLLLLLESNKLPVRKILFVQDPVQPQLTELFNKMEKIPKTHEMFNHALLSVSEMVIVTEAV
ncbi:glycosyltransferase [Paenibacillus radicis (ex Xue et al. 2023)]|uniref:Glycosyltransferase n=1 Tax=Paenibacillus radicis (ex Xue et al. 2023) TaxID=2972489 RepID=A0ABT1YPD3_9BACL|nr:glycosyltransferase [Paenibacillus radicis (ex Xue et al. 2023)]MCR8635032.1 glycosyltransferase [Paenibacillus radicis (ex Xue et al. 2023)]